MEGVFGALGAWMGLNLGILVKAGVAGFLVAVISTAFRRNRPDIARLAGAFTLLALFGYRTAQVTAAVVYLRTENRDFAILAMIVVAIFSVLVGAVSYWLRSHRRMAIAASMLGIVLLGASAPIADRLASVKRGGARAELPSLLSEPANYPRVSIWASEIEGFAARFPSEPTRIDAAALGGSGYAFQSTFTFEDGGAVATVFIAPLSFTLDSASQHRFLANAHRSFLSTIGASVDSSLFRWVTLGKGTPVLQYEATFAYQGVAAVGKGFWLVNGARVYRASVAYPSDLSATSAHVADFFPQTFVLLGSRKEP